MPDTYTCPVCSTKSDQWSERFQDDRLSSFECECGAIHTIFAGDGALHTVTSKQRRVANREVAAMRVRDEFDSDGPADY